MSYQDLEAFRNQLFTEMESQSFNDRFGSQAEEIPEIFWSKGPSYSIVPLELEMSGVVPSIVTAKEPSLKKNAQKLYFCDGKVLRVDFFNTHGLHHETEKFLYLENNCISLKINNHRENVWLKMSELERGKTIKAGRVDFDSEFWMFRYKWKGDVITEITSFCSSSLPGVVIYPEYDKSGKLTRLYFLNGEEQVEVFKASKI